MVGGFLLGDGFEGVIALAINDSSSDTCDETIHVQFTVQVSCYPDRPKTTQASVEAQTSLSPDSTDTSSITPRRLEFQIPAGVDLG
jgi:hypothetical protein